MYGVLRQLQRLQLLVQVQLRISMILSVHTLLEIMNQDTYINGFTGAVNVTLTAEELKYLEEPYHSRSIMGH